MDGTYVYTRAEYEWDCLQSKLQTISLQQADEEDLILSSLNASSRFQSNDIYRRLTFPGIIDTEIPLIWKVTLPSKIKIFAWLLLHDKVLSKENLVRRQMAVTVTCLSCIANVAETTFHLFWECDFARLVWDKVFKQLNLPFQPGGSLVKIWTCRRKTLDKQTRIKWDIWWFWTCWSIWRARNEVNFRGGIADPGQCFNQLKSEINSWWRSNPTLSVKFVRFRQS